MRRSRSISPGTGRRARWAGWAARLAGKGAIRWQCSHSSRTLAMSSIIPGQNIDVSALAVIIDTPWCAAWRAASTACRSAGGMMMRSL